MIVLLVSLFATFVLSQNCNVPNASKVDCQLYDQQTCQAGGCCWQPAGDHSVIPWCYRPAGWIACNPPIFGSNDTSVPPFADSELNLMRTYFLENLNYGGIGAVLASPDANVLQGGSYRYHWSRDGALSMRTLLQTFVPGVVNNSLVYPYMMQYVKFVLQIHSQQDPFGQSILTEPKFNLDGSVYSGGWCRPQTDGPGLRAVTLIMFAQSLIQQGQSGVVKQYLWTGNDNVYGGGAIKRDLDWIANGGWQQNSCDLWEEVQSTDFFWGRMSHNRAMHAGSLFAQLMGDQQSSQRYFQTQQAINATLLGHWNGQYLFEATNRPIDGATLAALNDGVADDMHTPFTPTSHYVAATVNTMVNSFCAEYAINNIDTARGIPGVLIGRYPGDHYGGGNPWILLSNHLALLFYRGAVYTARTGVLPSEEAMVHWGRLFPHMPKRVRSHVDFANTLLAAGDGVLQRVRYHVAGNGFHLSEQIDRNSGVELSAYDLTWSYGTMLKATWYRSLAASLLAKKK